MTNHKLPKNIYFEKIRSDVQQIMTCLKVSTFLHEIKGKECTLRTLVSTPVTLYNENRRPVSSYCAELKLNSLIQTHIILLLHLRLNTLSVPSRRQCHLAIRYGEGATDSRYERPSLMVLW